MHRPRKKRHGINIRITILGFMRGAVKVGHSVVPIVLILPPRDGETLHEVTPEKSYHISIQTVFEHLMVQEVMRQPSALLPEKS